MLRMPRVRRTRRKGKRRSCCVEVYWKKCERALTLASALTLPHSFLVSCRLPCVSRRSVHMNAHNAASRLPANAVHERRVMSWASDPTPLAYDCSPSHAPHLKAMSAWSRTCRIAAARHKPRQAARLLSWRDSGAGRPNVWQLVQQLGNRTVWILGDSHVLDLWCALACVVLRASHSSDFQQRGSQWQLVTRLRPDDHGQPPGPDREVRWRVPTCAYAKGGVCGGGTHCGTLGRTSCRLGCGLSLLPSPDADEA
jgi:hypothetical protein